MSDDDTTLEIRGLEKLLKALKAKPPTARIGILGSGADRNSNGSGDVPSNAQIGFWHEYGSKKVPKRSFLRQPLSDNLDKRLESSGAFDKDTLTKVLASGSIIPWIKKIMIEAEAVVAEGFSSGGFGQWPSSNMAHKKNHQTLVETGQLRDSITSEVKE